MKTLILIAAVALAVAGLPLVVRAETSPGFVEFGKIPPPGKGAEYVEVQIRSNLLKLAAGVAAKENPAAADLLKSVELVQVRVVGITKDNRAELDQTLARIRADLDARNWERNVTVQGKKGEDVAIFTKSHGTEALAGVAITVKDDKHIVLANIVGNIKPEQVAALGESLDIEPLKQAGAALKSAKPAEPAEKD